MTFAAELEKGDRLVQQHLGETVRYTSGAGVSVDVPAVFSEAYAPATPVGAKVVASSPAVFLRLAGLPSDPEVDFPTITRLGVTYRVHEPQKDGDGGVMLLLTPV